MAEALHQALGERRWILLASAFATLLTVAVDPPLTGELDATVMAARLLLAASLVALAAAGRTLSPRTLHLLAVGVGTLGSAVYCVIVARTGGADSPFTSVLLLLPFAFTLLIPVDPLASGIHGAVNTVLTVWTLRASSPGAVAFWLVVGPLTTAFVVLVAVVNLRARVRLVELLRANQTMGQTLRQTERLSLMGQMTASIAHEINNPLSYLISNVLVAQEMARERSLDADDDLTGALRDAAEGAERIRQIVSDMKNFAHRDSAELDRTDVQAVIQSAVRIAQVRLKRICRIELDVPGDLPPAVANAGRLSQVLVNLLVNSGDALEEHPRAAPHICVTARIEAGELRISVADNGPGIPAVIRSRVFKPFVTTKAPGHGTGLGLSLSREYVESFGGRIAADTSAEGGAMFSLWLRTAQQAAAVG